MAKAWLVLAVAGLIEWSWIDGAQAAVRELTMPNRVD
jgi:hypothetical protein